MECRGNVVTMREVTKEQDSPVEQGATKEETIAEENSQGRRVSTDQ